jgi:hypothetical protein
VSLPPLVEPAEELTVDEVGHATLGRQLGANRQVTSADALADLVAYLKIQREIALPVKLDKHVALHWPRPIDSSDYTCRMKHPFGTARSSPIDVQSTCLSAAQSFVGQRRETSGG